MYQDDCPEVIQDVQCGEGSKDAKKAVELSIVILVDQDEKCPPASAPSPPPAPSQSCCQPCCTPCCMPVCCACQIRPCSSAHRSPCGAPALPAPPCTAPTTTSTGTDPCVPPAVGTAPCGKKPISVCVDTRGGKRDPCSAGAGAAIKRTQSSAACQTVSQQTCQTDPCCLSRPGTAAGTQCTASQTTASAQTGKPPCTKKTAVSQTYPDEGKRKICKSKSPKPAGAAATGQAADKIRDTRTRDKSASPEPGQKKRRHHHKHKHKKRRSSSRGKRGSVPIDQIKFEQCSGQQMTFVQYFLKSEHGGPLVVNLSETKLQYEKQCKQRLSKMAKHLRFKAQEFFLQIIDAINTTTPDTQHTEIKHFHVMKYLHPVMAALNIDAAHETHTIHKYQNKYLLKVCRTIEERMNSKQMIDPTCLVEIETQLLAGFVARIFPFFIKVKETLLTVINHGGINDPLTPEEFIKQIRKLLLCAYVEIACLDNTFTNSLTSMSYLENVATQESFRQQLILRRKHARHSIKWAARCLATVILYYYINNFEGE